ncbi:MAG: hypothetical protein Q8P38_11690 [Candidatus Nanopelagicales bacterium]|nr:hypothetical protein [Candidatus Nanopelagicales bacterium]MDZ7577588.1 hypothetical protein [Candidatus Nanopelagicales bacterium]
MDLAVNMDALADVCRRYGLAEVAVFGSVARRGLHPLQPPRP